MSTRYLGVAGLARALGVSRQWVTKYRAQYGPESDHPFPAPDVEIVTDLDDDQADGVPGWLPERVDEVRQWRAGLPGRGAGGGRPLKAAEQQLVDEVDAVFTDYERKRAQLQRARNRRSR